MPVVTALYAGLIGLLAIAIGFPAGMMRGKLNISVGDGGNKDLLLAMRRHGNFAEWAPLALLLIALLEMNIAPKTPIHVLGAGLVLARIAHAVSLRGDTVKGVGRGLGAMGTAIIVAVASIWLIYAFVVRML